MNTQTVQEKPAPYGVTMVEIAEERVLLHGVSWNTFEGILKDIGNNRRCRLAYDQGALEIMSPHRKHETSTLSIHDFIVILFDELNLDYCAMGHLTCKREDLQRGLEPDCCYYVQNEPMIHGKEDIDLAIDPPPDLMIEVDITNSSLVKLPICAALGVTEHWRYDGEKLQFRILRAGAYAEVSESPAFPGLPLKEAIPDFVKRGRSNGQLRTLREFRKWVRAQLNKKS